MVYGTNYSAIHRIFFVVHINLFQTCLFGIPSPNSLHLTSFTIGFLEKKNNHRTKELGSVYDGRFDARCDHLHDKLDSLQNRMDETDALYDSDEVQDELDEIENELDDL